MDRSTAYRCRSDLAHGRFDNEASLSVTLLLPSTGVIIERNVISVILHLITFTLPHGL